MEIALAVLPVLTLPIAAIAGLVLAVGARDRVGALEQRFAEFQRARPADSAAAPPSAAIPAQVLPLPQTAAAAAHA